MKRLILFTTVVGVSACSSSGNEGLIGNAFGALIGKDPAPTEDSVELTRAQINKIDLAMIKVTVPAFGLTAIAVANHANGDRITYAAAQRRSLTMRGGLIAGTHGFGSDLSPISANRIDPIAYPRSLDRWPTQIKRTYWLSGYGPNGNALEAHCEFSGGTDGAITIVEMTYTVSKVYENCVAGDLQFTNVHWVDKSTGFIWQSDQWTGPKQMNVTYQVLEVLD